MQYTSSGNSFGIRDIENLSGIRAHTLRIWEQRYKFPCPKRKTGNHRCYDTEELKQILRIAFLYHQGHKISKIVQLSDREICQLTIDISSRSGFDGLFINQLTESSVDFDQERFDKILHNAILRYGFEKCIVNIVFPFLNKIGVLWLTGNIIPAHEHFASALIIKKLHVAIDGLPCQASKKAKTVAIYSPRGELHEIPLLFMWYTLKKNKINTVYFGHSTTLTDLQYYCRFKTVSHLYLHLITNNLYNTEEYLAQVAKLFADKEIVVSGNNVLSLKPRLANVRVLQSAEDILQFASS